MDVRDIIIKPLISEKAVAAMTDEKHPKYHFQVAMGANKTQIKEAVEKIFGVKVVSVNTVRTHGKFRRVGKFVGRRSDVKKAIVTLAQGETIKVFEGL
jgi:large subunit ribosomal protein L23